ncbi:Arm DNA-binding domain-containing protein [Lutimonas vermicola]|uniref:Arm DNA-binding domain-containing protein n=1 Tax=Lutimonas vermicola TaxID=414288 RepID=UPI003CC79D79
MNTLKLNIRYLVITGRLNKSGLTPIRCRITYNRQRKDFSTGIFINPDHWDPKNKDSLIRPGRNNQHATKPY